MWWFFITLFLFTQRVVIAQMGGAGEAEYGMELTSDFMPGEVDTSSNGIDTSGLTSEKIDLQTTIVKGELILSIALTETNSVQIVILKKMVTGHWESVTTMELKNTCQELENKDSTFAEILDKISIPKSCPVPEGNYTITDMKVAIPMEWNDSTLGDYRVMFSIYIPKDDGAKTIIASITFDFKVEAYY